MADRIINIDGLTSFGNGKIEKEIEQSISGDISYLKTIKKAKWVSYIKDEVIKTITHIESGKGYVTDGTGTITIGEEDIKWSDLKLELDTWNFIKVPKIENLPIGNTPRFHTDKVKTVTNKKWNSWVDGGAFNVLKVYEGDLGYVVNITKILDIYDPNKEYTHSHLALVPAKIPGNSEMSEELWDRVTASGGISFHSPYQDVKVYYNQKQVDVKKPPYILQNKLGVDGITFKMNVPEEYAGDSFVAEYPEGVFYRGNFMNAETSKEHRSTDNAKVMEKI